ncbi:MAG: hypothetical protein IT445_18445 [Phycisphaeraceae bacterium]|nr:hypothetical protein [Phycisphaeraceae bacterium]
MTHDSSWPSTFVDDPDMTDLVGYFVRQLPQRIAALELAAQWQRQDDLKLLAQQLRSGDAAGIVPIRQAARELEVLLDNRQPLEMIGASAQRLARLCRDVVEQRRGLLQSPHVDHDDSPAPTA